MIVIPDLFGSYQKGREAAIDANWKDLQNYESIENARHQNDASALSNLATMADFGVRRRMVQNEGTNSDLNTQLNIAQMPAKLNIAEGDSLVTGMQLGNMKANEDAIRQALADQLGAYVLGAGTGYNNAVVAHGKSTIGRNTFTDNYEAFYKAVDGKTKADIDMMEAYSQHMPTITRNNYRGQVYSSAGAADAAGVDYKYAIPIAEAKNRAGLSSYELSDANSRLGILQTDAQTVTFARDQLNGISSQIRVLQEMQSAYSQDDPRWKNLQADIDNLQGKAADLGKFLGANFMLNYNPVKVYAGAGTTSGGATSSSTGTTSSGTGSTTYVDPSTGRAITVPYAATGVGPLASGYVPYGSNGTNLFTGSSQPRTLSEITANLTTPRQNVMGVPNIGNVPNSALVKPAKATVRHYLPNGQVLYTTK